MTECGIGNVSSENQLFAQPRYDVQEMPSPIRAAVRASPDYPFTPIDAPIKLDQNESATDFPAELKAIVAQRIQVLPWNRYPDLHSNSLCASIGAHEDWPEAGVVVTTGSNVLIPLLAQLAGLGKRLVTVKPNFPLYSLGAKLLEVPLTEIPLQEDFSLDIASIIAEVSQYDSTDGGVLFLAQPHAPTGSNATIEEITQVADAAPDWLVVIDEAYHHFSAKDFKILARSRHNVVLLRTFSKAWGLAGLRLGYVLASEESARQLRKLIPPFTISILQLVAAQVALEHAYYMQDHTKQVIAERERVYRALQEHPTWTTFPSEGNFLLIRTLNAETAFNKLLEQGVLVRRQDGYFGLTGCIRASIGTPSENDSFLSAAMRIK